ncbi:polysaccharide biosynthesis protein [Methanofervidicoccus sp. A16]|uniref:flippase n=1 Tax=Methanofervidicoccus sp. A16 TaxID=2607662 RepID=UPI001189452C|nr:flippase [Methanofervidicoccus sp. A16]AXI24809.1 polysaccharide biosynthesis protein [Methanofervidicoccus sp. A16]
MSVTKRILKNTGILFVANILSKFFGFLYFMCMARYLGAEGYGIISFALAFTGMFSILTDMGLQLLIVREVARYKEIASKYLGNVVVIKFILGIITFLLIFLSINLMGYPSETKYVVYIISLYVIINSFNLAFYSIYQAYEKMEYVGIGNIINSLLLFIGVLIGIYLNFNVLGLAFIYLTVSGIILLYNITITMFKFLKVKLEIDLNFWREILKKALPFALSSIFVAIYFWADSVMLSYMIGDRAVGIYNAAYRLVYVLLFIPTIYFTSIYPVLSKMYLESKNKISFMYHRSLKYISIVGLFIGIITTLFAEQIIVFIYGYEYFESVIVLKILIWAVVFSFMAHATVYTLNSINKPQIYTKITGFCAVLNILLNIYAIQKLGYIGASITTVFTEFLGFLAMFLYLKYYFNENIISYLWIIKLFFGLGLIATFYLYTLNYINKNIVLHSIITLIFFITIITLIFIIIFDEIDYKLFKKILKRRKNYGSS